MRTECSAIIEQQVKTILAQSETFQTPTRNPSDTHQLITKYQTSSSDRSYPRTVRLSS